jgi:SAM-dependent methyltransferase
VSDFSKTFPAEYFKRDDERDDALFYQSSRKVVHIDEQAITALSLLFEEILPGNGQLLDLMSSWRSHLPDSLHSTRVTGLGMNAEEMADNPQLDQFLVHNLNQTPELPFESAQFDAVVCTVSVQYLIRPVDVFREVHRVLKTAAPFVISFSNRCFPEKAVAIWRNTDDQQHVSLITHYFAASGNWTDAEVREKPSSASLFYISDPLYAVWAYKE